MEVDNIVNGWKIEIIFASKYNERVIESQTSESQDIIFTDITFS